MARLLLPSVVAVLLGAGCDSERPAFREDLVVEAFFDTGRGLPEVGVRRTLPPARTSPGAHASDAAVTDATVVVDDGLRRDTLRPVDGRPGRYRSARRDTVQAARAYNVVVSQGTRLLIARAVPPPRLTGFAARATPADSPERGVDLDLNSLGIGSTVANGYFYAVDVDVEWTSTAAPTHVVRAHLRPSAGASTLFFPTDVAVDEREAGEFGGGRRMWRRRYLVQVDGPTAPLPAHRVRVALVRGDADYRQFVDTRRTPSQRSPTSNVFGGLGMVTGVSVDSVTLAVVGR